MALSIEELTKNLGLTDEQKKLISESQAVLDAKYEEELKNQQLGLSKKNKELLDKLAAAKKNQVPDGIDLDGYKEYVSNKDQIEADKLKAEEDALIAKQNWDKLKNDITNSHEQTLNQLKQEKDLEIQSLKKALDSELIENVAIKEIDNAKGSHVLLIPHIKDSIQTFVNEEGKYDVKVVDSLGKDRINAETGNNMSVKELVAEFQANELFAGAFPLKNQGSNTDINSGGNNNFNGGNNPFDKKSKSYSLTEQAKLMKTNPVLAKKLKEAV